MRAPLSHANACVKLLEEFGRRCGTGFLGILLCPWRLVEADRLGGDATGGSCWYSIEGSDATTRALGRGAENKKIG